MKREILRDYEICEFIQEETDGLKTSIFDLKIDALVFEKMFIMFERVEPTQRKLDSEKALLKLKKDELLRTFDFKAELGITTKPTIADKEAVMKPHLQEYEDSVAGYEERLKCYKNKLEIINDLIKNKRIMLKIEAELEEE